MSSSTLAAGSLTTTELVRGSNEAKKRPFTRKQGKPIIVERVTASTFNRAWARFQKSDSDGTSCVMGVFLGGWVHAVGPRVGADTLALGSAPHSVEVVRPATGVGFGGGFVEAAMDQCDQGGSVGLGDQVDLDSG